MPAPRDVRGGAATEERTQGKDIMTTRNPLNERYTAEGGKKGTTRKSAASAKPVSKAGSSVHTASTPRKGADAKERKRLQKQQQEKEREIGAVLERKYYNPPWPKYRALRLLWLVLLILAVVCTFFTFLAQEKFSIVVLYSVLGVAYASIIGVLLIDFLGIRRMRKRYMQEMSGEIERDRRALEKAQKEAEWLRAKGKEVEDNYLYHVIEMPERVTFLDQFRIHSKADKKDKADKKAEAVDDAKSAAADAAKVYGKKED